MTALHQGWWQLKMKWWQISLTHVLADEPPPHPSTPLFNSNYYFLSVGQASREHAEHFLFLHRGLLGWWDNMMLLEFPQDHRKAENYSRVEMNLSNQDRFLKPQIITPLLLQFTFITLYLLPFFFTGQYNGPHLSSCAAFSCAHSRSLQLILQLFKISICAHKNSLNYSIMQVCSGLDCSTYLISGQR